MLASRVQPSSVGKNKADTSTASDIPVIPEAQW